MSKIIKGLKVAANVAAAICNALLYELRTEKNHLK